MGAGKHEGHFPASLPCHGHRLGLLPSGQGHQGGGCRMCPGGSEAHPCPAWHRALPHPPGREGKSLDRGNNPKLKLFRAAQSPLYNCQSFSPPLSASLQTAGMLTLLLVLSASSLTSAPEAKASLTQLP